MSTPVLQVTHDFLARLSGVQNAGNLAWQALCPAHKDTTPSLSVTQKHNRIVLHCHAGCSNRGIVAALGTDFRVLYQNDAKTPNISPAARPWARASAPVTGDANTDDEAKTTRRVRQAAHLYHNLKGLAPDQEIRNYSTARGIDIDVATACGARFGQVPRADLQNKTPTGWVKGEIADAILWPIYRAETILKTTRVLSGVQREWPWGCQDGPKSVKAILGKHSLDRRAGGFLIGALAGAKILYICEGPLTGIAIHMATGQPVLVLISEGGLRNIGADTIMDIRDSGGLPVCVTGDNDQNGVGQKAAQVCAQKILLTAPAIKVSISIPDGLDTDWLDVLNLRGPEETARAILANSRPPTLPTGPRGGQPHDDLSGGCPDLSGGPLGPEPPPIAYQGERASNVLPFTPWRERPHAAIPDLPSLTLLREEMARIFPIAIAAAMAGKPTLVKTPPGAGKTYLAERFVLEARNSKGDPATYFMLHPNKDMSRDSSGRMHGWSWDGRPVEGMCNLPQVTEVLMDKGRSPQQNACMSCEHGRAPAPGEEDNRCEFQKNLVAVLSCRGVHGQHAAGGRESTLNKYRGQNSGKADADHRDLLVIDEGIETSTTTKVGVDDIMAARTATGRIDEHIDGLRSKAEKKRDWRKKKYQEQDDRYSEEDYTDARDWAQAIAPELETLAGIMTSAPKNPGVYALDAALLSEFIRLGKKIPKAAQSCDATALEKVEGVFGDDPIVPLAWIKSLAKALKRGTAWVKVSKDKTQIVCTNPADLWERYLTKGGLLLDAGSIHDDEILAAGGLVFDLQCAQPSLHTVQFGPRLHGYGDGGKTKEGRARLESELKELLKAMGDDPDVVVITHKPLAKLTNDERVRWWGAHKGHNDWIGKTRLILWGLPLLPPDQQIIEYKTYRVAMAARGITMQDWNGETVKNLWVQTDTHEMVPAARMPSVKDARDWLIRRINSDVMQAVGRLRAVMATEQVTVEIYGFLPIQGFGLRVDEIRMESSGRLATRTATLGGVAGAVINLKKRGVHPSRQKIVDLMFSIDGVRHSNATIDCVMEELEMSALDHGITIDQKTTDTVAAVGIILDMKRQYGPQAMLGHMKTICQDPEHDMQAVALILTTTDFWQQRSLQRAGP